MKRKLLLPLLTTKRISFFVAYCCLLSFVSCVNDIDSIQKVTNDSKSADEVTKDLHVFYTDSGYAKIEIYSKLAETVNHPEHITKLKDGMKVNFFSEKGEIVSTLSANYGEVNFTKGMLFVKDSVRLFNHKKKQQMETELLFWNQKDSTVYTQSNVVVRSPDGVLYGQGVKTNQSFNYYEFLRPYGKLNLKN
ncbi:MAG: LPS export ABC transporter periplasmic protein LptC [Bacteroidota bacterium]